MNQLVISCSLSPTSHSALLAERLVNELRRLEVDAEWVDLRTVPLPFCDGGAAYDDEHAHNLARKISRAAAVTLAVPVYNYDVGGAARNLIAMAGNAWNNKVVGLVGAAGGERSYMALMSVANSLMLDFRSVIVPRYVYASKQSFADGQLRDPAVEERLANLAKDLRRFATALGAEPKGSSTR